MNTITCRYTTFMLSFYQYKNLNSNQLLHTGPLKCFVVGFCNAIDLAGLLMGQDLSAAAALHVPSSLASTQRVCLASSRGQ